MSRLAKWSAGVLIGCYLTVLAAGVIAHALKVGLSGNTLSYYVVWDMFCGWQAYDERTHLIAESSSGRYYEVREPWGEFCPFGSVGRYQYDVYSHMMSKQIRHVLTHSSHEPIEAVYVVQELWPKQYNLPESLWQENFGGQREKLSYFHLRAVCQDDGTLISLHHDWMNQQRLNSVADNPRLRHEARQAQSSFGSWYSPRAHVLGQELPESVTSMPATN